MSLYDDLEVPKGASPAEIRNAYRKAASKHHPDRKGGDVKKFQVIQYAYDVLGDKTKKARYDSGVNVEEVPIRIMAMQNLAGMVVQLVGGAADIASLDIIKELHKMIKIGREKANAGITECRRNIKKFEKAKKKLIFKGKGESFLVAVLDNQIQLQQHGITQAENAKEMGNVMEELLKDHDCSVEAKNPIAVFTYGFNQE